MRITIDLKDEYRAQLLELAARRGEKGFARLINDAVDAYLRKLKTNEKVRERALAIQGSFSEDEVAKLRQSISALRERW